MFGWLRELLEIKYEFKQKKLELNIHKQEKQIELVVPEDSSIICESCETLRQQLGIANQEKKVLLERLLDPKTQTEPSIDTSSLKPLMPRGAANRWADTRRMLEENDRAKARAVRESEAFNKISTEELEADLIAAEQPKTGTEGEKHGS